jgi:neurotransmitter:Na+ symporter, NSS family
LLIFSAVFAFGLDPAAGPGLTFVTLPAIFGQMPGGTIFAFAFFLLLAVAALTSAVSLLEVPVAYLMDEHGVSRRGAALLLGAIVFLLGIPSSLSLGVWSDFTIFGLGVMDFMDSATTKVLMPFGSILLSLFAGWVVYPRLTRELMQPAGDRIAIPLRVWGIVCKFLGPAAILWIMAASLFS